jgi:hypothetical protein
MRGPSSVGNSIDVLLAGQVVGLGVRGPAREIRKNAGVRLGNGASGAAAAMGIRHRQASKQGLLKRPEMGRLLPRYGVAR